MSRADDEGFSAFVAARSPALLRTAYLLTGDRGHAEDLVQGALLKAYRHWAWIQRKDQPEAFVRKVMLNDRRMQWRRRTVAEVFVPTVPDHAAPDAEGADADLVWSALAQLPPRMRAVLVLRYWEQLSERETAETLGCSVGTVKSQASRGLARLRDLLPAPTPEVRR